MSILMGVLYLVVALVVVAIPLLVLHALDVIVRFAAGFRIANYVLSRVGWRPGCAGDLEMYRRLLTIEECLYTGPKAAKMPYLWPLYGRVFAWRAKHRVNTYVLAFNQAREAVLTGERWGNRGGEYRSDSEVNEYLNSRLEGVRLPSRPDWRRTREMLYASNRIELEMLMGMEQQCWQYVLTAGGLSRNRILHVF